MNCPIISPSSLNYPNMRMTLHFSVNCEKYFVTKMQYLHFFATEMGKGRLSLPKRMNFRKSSKRSLTPPLIFRKIILQIFPEIHDQSIVYNGKNLQHKFLDWKWPPPLFHFPYCITSYFYNCWIAPKVQNRQILFTRLTRGTNPQPDHVMLRQRNICCLDSGCPDFFMFCPKSLKLWRPSGFNLWDSS